MLGLAAGVALVEKNTFRAFRGFEAMAALRNRCFLCEAAQKARTEGDEEVEQ